MTIPSETIRVTHVGAGTTGPFSVPYRFLDNEDLLVVKTVIATGVQSVLALTTDYTLTGAGELAGGALTLTAGHGALASTHRISIINDPDGLQETDYTPYDPFPAETHERAIDRLAIRSLRLQDLISRSLRQPDGDADNIDVLPSKVSRASMFLAFDADGDPMAVAALAGSYPVTPFVASMLDDADSEAVCITLGAASLNIEGQVLAGGATVTSKALGTAGVVSSGTVTPDPGDRPMQHYTNNGAHTLAPSANKGTLLLDITNGASAGAITTSGFTSVAGDSFTTTVAHKFRCYITLGEAGSLLTVQALQ